MAGAMHGRYFEAGYAQRLSVFVADMLAQRGERIVKAVCEFGILHQRDICLGDIARGACVFGNGAQTADVIIVPVADKDGLDIVGIKPHGAHAFKNHIDLRSQAGIKQDNSFVGSEKEYAHPGIAGVVKVRRNLAGRNSSFPRTLRNGAHHFLFVLPAGRRIKVWHNPTTSVIEKDCCRAGSSPLMGSCRWKYADQRSYLMPSCSPT